MNFPLVLIFLTFLSVYSNATKMEFRSYIGLEQQVPISSEVRSAMSHMNRYCGNGGYSYRPSYYRPSYNQPYNTGPNLASLISPVVFGLATGAGLAAVGNILG